MNLSNSKREELKDTSNIQRMGVSRCLIIMKMFNLDARVLCVDGKGSLAFNIIQINGSITPTTIKQYTPHMEKAAQSNAAPLLHQ